MVSNIKVLKDNSKNIEVKEENIKTFPLKIKCSECDSELEITEEDTHIGWLGARFITCPCCGEETYADELADYFPLTKDNVEFPTHYFSYNKAISVDDDTINKWVKECIEKFDPNDENDWVRCIGSGDTMVFVFKFDGDGVYQIYICKKYYETFIPINENNS